MQTKKQKQMSRSGLLFMFLKGSSRRQIVGQILLGLGLLFIGMKTMENAVSGLQELPAFRELFVAFSNPLLGILVGAAVTALIQSSSASMGILQAVSSTGVVSFHIAIPPVSYTHLTLPTNSRV